MQLLTIPTYEGSGQIVHPSILFHNNIYWLAFTPFPGSNKLFENPSLVVSNDGINWREECKNPLVNPPTEGHYNDPYITKQLVFNYYYVWHSALGKPIRSIIYKMTSPDGKTWSEPEVVVEGDGEHLMSPCILDDDMWYVVLDKDKTLRAFKNSSKLNINPIPFHLEVRRCGDKYIMLYNTESMNLYYAESKDGVTWTTKQEPLIIPSYKATFLCDNGLRVWYSHRDNMRNWITKYETFESPICLS